eukprot:12425668-Karenia_brevis.AAC.1
MRRWKSRATRGVKKVNTKIRSKSDSSGSSTTTRTRRERGQRSSSAHGSAPEPIQDSGTAPMNVDSSMTNTGPNDVRPNGNDGGRGKANDHTPSASPEVSEPKNTKVWTAGPYCLKCAYLGRTPIKQAKYMCTYCSGEMPCPMPSVCGEHGV